MLNREIVSVRLQDNNFMKPFLGELDRTLQIVKVPVVNDRLDVTASLKNVGLIF